MKIAFLGDIALIGKYDLTKNPEVRDRLKVLSVKLAKYDYVVGNLESPLTNKTKTMVCKSMHLKSATINVELLKYLNIDAVSLANNHTYDYGKKGLEETIKTLEDNGIEWFGVNSKEFIKEIKGDRVSISGFSCYSTNGSGFKTNNKSEGVGLLTYDNIMKQLDIDKKNKAFSIMSLHWGDEHTNYPKYEHLCLSQRIAKNKDVLIVGHHPHIIQGVQKINNSIVAYSLGNFIFDDCVSINGNLKLKQNSNNKKSFIFEVNIENGSIVSQSYHGFRDEENGFIIFDIENELNEISKPLINVHDKNKYEERRKFQINKATIEKFGKKDLRWIKSRFNYYSIGAFILRKVQYKKYLREASKFISDN
ncbi:MAG: CapA family protein [Vallitaleaceae bacterium]|nr:CapA family protein [Vallitaleaceae bacterium]